MDFSALTLSAGVVALAEMGDKTQLLSLMLAARYPKQALAIISGIFIATIATSCFSPLSITFVLFEFTNEMLELGAIFGLLSICDGEVKSIFIGLFSCLAFNFSGNENLLGVEP